jgi:hypothetical protein
LAHASNVEKVKFVGNNKLIAVGDNGHLMIVEFGEKESMKTMSTSFFRKYWSVGIDDATIKVEEIVYTSKRLYVLVN